MKPEFHAIYNAYSNESPIKYHISILGGGGIQNLGKPAYIILECSFIGDGSIGYDSNSNGSISIGDIGIGSISID